MSNPKHPLCLVLLLLCQAVASQTSCRAGFWLGYSGKPFDLLDASKIQVGMTHDSVIEIMGEPYIRAAITRNGEAVEIWTWMFSAVYMGSVRFAIILKDNIVIEVPEITE